MGEAVRRSWLPLRNSITKALFVNVRKSDGLSVDTISRLARFDLDFSEEGFDRKRIVDQGFEPDDKLIRRCTIDAQFMGSRGQLGQHTGGL